MERIKVFSLIFGVFTTLIISTNSHSTSIYQCMIEGELTFSDTPCSDGDVTVIKKETAAQSRKRLYKHHTESMASLIHQSRYNEAKVIAKQNNLISEYNMLLQQEINREKALSNEIKVLQEQYERDDLKRQVNTQERKLKEQERKLNEQEGEIDGLESDINALEREEIRRRRNEP